MNIRTFEHEDLNQVIDLANKYSSFDSDVTEEFFQPAQSFSQGFLVAEIDGKLVGFVFAYLREVPDEVLSRWTATKVAQIELLAVDTSYRRQGIGEELLDKLLRTLKTEGIDIALLHCPIEAKAAKHLYDKLGFEIRAYAMRKRL
ncbi:MAG: GNAT family N-acetyltransferase [Candidatus Thorarchaeota archaeon]|nr:GNAT family N-acetyltransferase [Candidatus Thorarchaeota archaeon]